MLYFRNSLSLIFLDVCPPLFVKISFSGIETEQGIISISFSVFCLSPFLCSFKQIPVLFHFVLRDFSILFTTFVWFSLLLTLLCLLYCGWVFFPSLNIHVTKHSFVHGISLTCCLSLYFLISDVYAVTSSLHLPITLSAIYSRKWSYLISVLVSA